MPSPAQPSTPALPASLQLLALAGPLDAEENSLRVLEMASTFRKRSTSRKKNSLSKQPHHPTDHPESDSPRSALPPDEGWASLLPQACVPPNPPATVMSSSSAAGAGGAAAARNQNHDWHEIPIVTMTPELKRDLVLIENRAHLDPKRFYKQSGTGRKPGELPQRVHVGVVVEAPHEYLSGRLLRKQRKASFADEVFSDPRMIANAKRRFDALQKNQMHNRRVIDPAAKTIRKRRRHGH